MFDTFYDRRSGFIFYTNPLGARADYSVVDEGGPNTDWNPVWDVADRPLRRRLDRRDGDPVQVAALPLGRRPGVGHPAAPRRSAARTSGRYLTPVPQNLAGPQALNRVSSAGTLVGLDLPPAGKNLELKPYAIARADDRSRCATPPLRNDLDGDVGGDVKYGVTANLTADFTVNTDFAQVEIDEQQVNLTRFSLFFPEKRDFFLEGRGIFDFGRGGVTGGAVRRRRQRPAASRTCSTAGASASIAAASIPIDVGGRLTGKVGTFGVGVMNIQTGDEDGVADRRRPTSRWCGSSATSCAAAASARCSPTARSRPSAHGLEPGLRRRRGVLVLPERRRSAATTRAPSTPGLDGDDDSYQGRFDYGADRYGAQRRVPEGRRQLQPRGRLRARATTSRASFASAALQPAAEERSRRCASSPTQASFEYFENGAGDARDAAADRPLQHRVREQRQLQRRGRRATTSCCCGRSRRRPASSIPAGGYHFNDAHGVATPSAQQRRVVGHRRRCRPASSTTARSRAVGFSTARVSILKQFSVEPSISINRVELPTGDVHHAGCYRARADYGFSPRMFASALLQYSSADHTFSSNLRFRWEYRPGSELFVVYTDEHDTRPNGTGLRNRAFVVKVTRLFRF